MIKRLLVLLGVVTPWLDNWLSRVVAPWLGFLLRCRRYDYRCRLLLSNCLFIHLQISDDVIDFTFLGSAALEVEVEIIVAKLKKFFHHFIILFVFLRKLVKIVCVVYFSKHFSRRIFFVILLVVDIGVRHNRHVMWELGRFVTVINLHDVVLIPA